MKASIGSSRRASEFARLLDAPNGAVETGARGELGELVETVAALRAVPQPNPDPDFAHALRGRLLRAADGLWQPAGAPSTAPLAATPARLQLPPPRRTPRKLATLVASVIMIGSTVGVATASNSALPGDALYPVKRGLEKANVAFSGSATAQGRSYLDQAGDRLTEMQQLLDRGDNARTRALLAQTLRSFSSSAQAGGNALLGVSKPWPTRRARIVQTFAVSSMPRLLALQRLSPDAMAPSFVEAAEQLSSMSAAAQRACPGCGGDALAVPSELTPVASSGLENLVNPAARLAAAADAQAPRTPSTSTLKPGANAARDARVAESVVREPRPSGPANTGPAAPNPWLLPLPPIKARKDPVTGLVEGLDTATKQLNTTLTTTTDSLTKTLQQTTRSTTDLVEGITGSLQRR